MSQVRLKNSTGGMSKIGQQVKLVTGSKTAFVKADFWDIGIIGTIAQAVPNGNICAIDLLGTILSTSQQNVVISPNAPVSPAIGTIWIEASIT